MPTLFKYGDGCREHAKGTCTGWHPKERNFGSSSGGAQDRDLTKMEKAKRAYSEDNMIFSKEVEYRLIAPKEVDRLAKVYDGYAEVRMHTMRRSTERLVTEKTVDGKEIGAAVDGVRVELPTPNCYSIQNGSWRDFIWLRVRWMIASKDGIHYKGSR